MLQPEPPSKNKRKHPSYLSIFTMVTTLLLLLGSILLFSYLPSVHRGEPAHTMIKNRVSSTAIVTRGTNTHIHETETQEPENPTATLTSVIPTATAQSPGPSSPTAGTATSVPTVYPTPTSSLVSIPYYPYRGTLALNDSLIGGSQGWENFSAHNEFCGLVGGGYEVTGYPWGLDEGNFSCHEEQSNFSNFVFEMQVNLVSYNPIDGSNSFFVCPGISFDSTGSAGDSTEYVYYVCSSGSFGFTLSPKGMQGIVLAAGHAASAHQGLYATNTLAVSADEGHFTLYMNGQVVAHADSAFYSFGHIGCETFYSFTNGTARCSNAKVWTI